MTPRDVQKTIKQYSRNIPFIERILMNWRPRICPFHLLLEAVPENARVLDIGSGTGLMLFLLSHFGRISKGVGIEINRKKLEIAQSLPWKDRHVSFHHILPADEWPATDIDCILLIDVLHHVPCGQQHEFIERIRKSGAGTVVFKDINPLKKCKTVMNTIHDIVLSREVPHYVRPEVVCSWLREMGFAEIQLTYPEMLWYSHYLITAKRTE